AVRRFCYAIPTDPNVRVFTANPSYSTFSYDINDISQQFQTRCDPNNNVTTGCMPRAQRIQVGSFEGEPVDPGIHASYQDELTVGVEKAIDPTLSVGIKATYRSLGRTIEDRCDLNYATNPTGSSCALTNPGSAFGSAATPGNIAQNPGAAGAFGSCNGSANPVTNPT